MPTDKVKQKVQDFAKILRAKKYSFESIYLFGSYAKGKQKKDSDIDVAVIVRRPGSGKRYLDRKMQLWRLSADADSKIESVLIGLKDLEEGSTTLANEVKQKGIQIV